MPTSPEALYVRGRGLPQAERWVTVVGGGRSSGLGCAFARAVREELARRRAVVISGLAIGIDLAAHEGTVRGNGAAAAVLA